MSYHTEGPGFDDPAGRPHEEIGEELRTFARVKRLMTCQYCGQPTVNTYTCQACRDGWPVNDCRCENNGDYCEACQAWIEYRREAVHRDHRTTAG